MAFVEKQFGAEGLDRVMGNLDPEDQKALRGVIPVAWLDFEIGKRLDDTIVEDKCRARGDEACRYRVSWQ